MASRHTVLFFISCVLFIRIRSIASQTLTTTKPQTSQKPTDMQPPTGGPGTMSTPVSNQSNEPQPSQKPTEMGPPARVTEPKPATISSPTEGSVSPSVGGQTNASDTNNTETKSGPEAMQESIGSTQATAMDPTPIQTADGTKASPTKKSEHQKPDAFDNNINETKSGSDAMQGSPGKPAPTPKPGDSGNKKYLWILLPVGVAVVAVAMYIRSKFFKVHHHPETTDNGTENASFQRTESNKDGVMLLGVKSSGTEEGAAAK